MRIVLTGATGFLGSHLTRCLIGAGHRVTAAVRGSSDLTRIEDLLEQIHLVDLDLQGVNGLFKTPDLPEAVIHTATFYGRGETLADEVYETNVRFPVELAELAADLGVRTFINTDTFYPGDYPPLLAYARSKKQFADWGRAHAQCKGNLFVNLCLQHLYGPGDSDDKFIPFLIKSCLEGKPEIPLTEGKQKRDLIYVSDAVQAYLEVLSSVGDMPPGCHEFDVGTGISLSIRSLAELIHKTAGSVSTLLFGAVPVPVGELMDSVADIRKLMALGWEPKVSIEEGITRTVQFYTAATGSS